MAVRRAVTSIALALLFAATTARAQPAPRFNATWTRVEPALSPDATDVERLDVQGSVLRMHVEQRGSAGTLGYGFTDDRTYAIDGPLESKTDQDGRIRTVAVHWEGADLVFVRTTTEGLNIATEREVWSVSADGTRLTKASETTDWRGMRTARRVYARTGR
jgi:hypothetical protein